MPAERSSARVPCACEPGPGMPGSQATGRGPGCSAVAHTGTLVTMRRTTWLALTLLAACGPSPDDTATGSDTTSPDTTGDTTSSLPTTGPDVTTTTTAPTTRGDTTATTDTTDATTSSTTDTALCGPPCDEPWIHDGDLYIDEDFDLSTLRCLVEVHGYLYVTAQPTLPLELANLRKVEGHVDFGAVGPMTNLAGFECLEEVGGSLQLLEMHELADISALAGLERVGGLVISENPLLTDLSLFDGISGLRKLSLRDMDALTTLPVPGPDALLASLSIEDCPLLTDLDALAGVPSGPQFEIALHRNNSLASVAGLASATFTTLGLSDLPALTSIDSLDAAEGAWIWMTSLPLIDDLGPLAGLTELGLLYLVDLPALASLAPLAGTEHIGNLFLDDLPKLASLAPLADLRRVESLVVGGCSEMIGQEGVGLDALTDLAPLEGLEQLQLLSIGRNDSLVELPKFAALEFPIAHGAVMANPMLTPAEITAFSAAHPAMCADPPADCTCPQDLPTP